MTHQFPTHLWYLASVRIETFSVAAELLLLLSNVVKVTVIYGQEIIIGFERLIVSRNSRRVWLPVYYAVVERACNAPVSVAPSIFRFRGIELSRPQDINVPQSANSKHVANFMGDVSFEFFLYNIFRFEFEN